MRSLSKALLLVAVLGLAACNNPDRFGAGGAGGMGGDGAGGIATTGLGDPSDPASPAYFQQTVGDRVLFPVDQSTLTDAARTILIGQAAWLNANVDYAVIIEGHADEQGTREYNLALGARRASAVQDFLISQGVGPSRMRTVSYGKERPVEICSDEACYAKNRRAVTVLQMGVAG
ncbi:MAG: peptidoglycan-associated lipoprotein Pal [Rhodobacter sp.]|jgi:peptidoglycan-associated lipoprotein|nr:peptidoglycan-associated lipoprotein Pal [Rhodobacter sp.]MCA3458103.1 peptidoglycan-associated lipoprotein Pal [Rhodobacter sp.]MCA3460496.1 peptidoglycan-associated lipoprotein Pal [Rhodobacter sp.]MCA3465091.1 peptidoglycan-associated lipoprotein Pal [Rhodobacter sp.]MCA3468850.1 peptidoglycan-associated lipoprotein Pal [Rhodobacter sp.]